MKKILFLILVASFTLSQACKNQESSNPELANKNPVAEAVEEEASAPTGKAMKITKADFLEKVMDYEKNTSEWKFAGDKPCIVDFYADWCRPCKIASPVLDELAAEYAGKINVYKVDTQVERELASVFGVRSIPTFLFCPLEGEPSMTSGIGRTPEETKEMFKQYIEEYLLSENQPSTSSLQ